jgi:hypothetical protein
MKYFKLIFKYISTLLGIIFISSIVFLVFIINSDNLKLKQDRKTLKKIFKNKTIKENILNDYKEVFLPKTHFLDLDMQSYKVKPIKVSDCYVGKCFTFFMDEYEDHLLILDRAGDIFYIKIEDFLKENKNFKKIKTNLNFDKVLDLYIKEKNIYISGKTKLPNGDYKISLQKAIIKNLNRINFKELFNSKDKKCINGSLHSGKIQHLNGNINDGILFSTMSVIQLNYPNLDIQSNKTICGKILLIDENTSKYEHYAKGFRNVIGLYAEKDLILATDNGPMGGDEINNVLLKQNYGWPIASYGDLYPNKNNKKDYKKIFYYKKNHFKNGYVEPIFSFLPSIGISEIIRLSNNFSILWQDNFLISSLNKKTLYRVKFDKDYNKIIYLEEIFIGDRIRDVLYLEKQKTILLSLELSGDILVLKNKMN